MEEDQILGLSMEIGADDVHSEEEYSTIITKPNDYQKVRSEIEKISLRDHIIDDESGIVYITKEGMAIECDAESSAKNNVIVEKLMDIQYSHAVFHNMVVNE